MINFYWGRKWKEMESDEWFPVEKISFKPYPWGCEANDR